jgi:zinc transporter, ZIP family
MSFAETVLLGALAGFTIYLGLPVGRLANMSRRTRVALAMFAVGILAFLFADIFEHGLGILEEPWEELGENGGEAGEAIGYLLLLGAGFAAGTAGPAFVERRLRGRNPSPPPVAGGSVDVLPADQADLLTQRDSARRNALRVGMTVAAAIGVHNLAEGLAIGVSANSGEIALATVLIIGFALHNATEGFGIVAPLSGGDARPSWRFLALLGLIGGGPTFIGTLIGQAFVSEALEIGFLALAAGSILYVVIELMNVNRQLGYRTLVAWALLFGLFLGFGTDFVLAVAGG